MIPHITKLGKDQNPEYKILSIVSNEYIALSQHHKSNCFQQFVRKKFASGAAASLKSSVIVLLCRLGLTMETEVPNAMGTLGS